MIQHFSYNRQFDIGFRESLIKNKVGSNLPNGIELATCNRYEVYWGDGKVLPGTIRHLFRVTSGLESGLTGETSVQNQVKQSYVNAAMQKKLTKGMHRLFQTALFVGKNVRQQTGISKGAVSHSQAVVRLLEQQNFDFENKSIAIIGLNKLNESVINYLKQKNCKTILLGNRSYEKIKKFESSNCKAFPLDALQNCLLKADAVISATSAPHFIIGPGHIPDNRFLQIFDLAVPRDVDPSVKLFDNVTLYTVHDVENEINKSLAARRDKILQAEEIIEREAEKFEHWQFTNVAH